MLKKEAIFLDLDNTILDSKGAYKYSLEKLSHHWKKIYGENDFLHSFEEKKKIVTERLRGMPTHRSRILVFKELIDERELSLHSEKILYFERKYFQYFVEYIKLFKRTNKKKYKKLFSLLDEFSRNKNIYLLTNESLKTQLIKTKNTLPTSLNINLITSEEVGKEKPTMDYFSYVLQRAKVNPSQAIMIGDSYEDDICGAIHSGVRAIQVLSVFGEDSIQEGIYKDTKYVIYGNVLQALESLQRIQ